MSEPKWVLLEVVNAVHQMLLAEHGGGTGIRDQELLASALARAKQKHNYEPESSFFDLAASYSFGLAKNHAFVDGNKRTAFTVGVIFLEINGYEFFASETDATLIFEALASGEISEDQLSEWFSINAKKA